MRRLLSSVLFVVLGLYCVRSAFAVEGAPYLLSPEGVHAAGLAGAFGAGAGSPEALWYNPGALTDLTGVEASFARSSLPGGFDSDHLLLAGPLNWTHHLGLLYHRNGTQDTYRDALGQESGSFEVSQSVLALGYSYRWRELSVGASYKSLSEVLERQSASSSVFDLGALMEFSRDALVLGAAVQNIGSAPALGSGGPTVEAPLLVRASANMRFNTDFSRWQLLGDYRYLVVSQRSGFSVGLDYSEEYQDARLGLRAGWDFSQSALGGIAGLAVGAGIGYGPVGLDYAFAPREALGSQQRLALTLMWDLRAKNKEQDLAGYLNPSGVPSPSPTATVLPKSIPRSSIKSSLDALLAATPSPTPQISPTPVVEEKRQPGKGILGALARLFSFGNAPGESVDSPEKPAGLLRGVFNFFGFNSSATPEAPASPGTAAKPTPQTTPTALPMQRLKGDSNALEPSPVPTPIADKLKSWMNF